MPQSAEDSAKRRQIVEGARSMFLAQGFDAASMSDIARAAGVSKGTLYVYFNNKEQLFEAIVHEECRPMPKAFSISIPSDHDVEEVLMRLGAAYVEFLCSPEKASALRTVIAIADRMPEIGKVFYETGPGGIASSPPICTRRTKPECSRSKIASGGSPIHGRVPVHPVQAGAVQFPRAPAQERIEHVVGIAVRTFLAAYRPR